MARAAPQRRQPASTLAVGGRPKASGASPRWPPAQRGERGAMTLWARSSGSRSSGQGHRTIVPKDIGHCIEERSVETAFDRFRDHDMIAAMSSALLSVTRLQRIDGDRRLNERHVSSKGHVVLLLDRKNVDENFRPWHRPACESGVSNRLLVPHRSRSALSTDPWRRHRHPWESKRGA